MTLAIDIIDRFSNEVCCECLQRRPGHTIITVSYAIKDILAIVL